jgi:broad specificity phosphatase PhoE
MSTLYLVRHGQASFGTDNYDQLSVLGRQQVQILAEHLAGSGERFDRIYSGTLQRQRETAEILASGLGLGAPIVPRGAYDEYDSDSMLRTYAASQDAAQLAEFGWPELRHDRRKFQLFLERAAQAWVAADIQHEELLPWRQFHSRIVGGLRELMEQEGRSRTILLSTSGGVIGTIVAHVLGLSNHLGIELNWAVHNASITRLIYNSQKISLSMFNALPHLERTEHRQLITYR